MKRFKTLDELKQSGWTIVTDQGIDYLKKDNFTWTLNYIKIILGKDVEKWEKLISSMKRLGQSFPRGQTVEEAKKEVDALYHFIEMYKDHPSCIVNELIDTSANCGKKESEKDRMMRFFSTPTKDWLKEPIW